MVRRFRCSFCKALVLCNDAERTISHEAPECLPFNQLMHSGTGRVYTFAERLDPETGTPLSRPKA
jgi:hypothetical protein